MRYTSLAPIGMALALVMVTAPSVSAQVPRRPFLFKDGRVEVATARARGDSGVTLVMAAMPGQNGRLARAVTALGGTIRFRDDDVDYIRAFVPVDSVGRLEGNAALHSIDVTKPQNRGRGDASATAAAGLPSRSAGHGPPAPQDTTKKTWPPKLSDYPLTNRYHPLADLGGAEFRENNPTFDGRGVTIGMIDLNPDPLLPELQVALTLDGEPIPKIVAYQTAIDVDEQDDGRWITMTDTVAAGSGRFTYQDSTYMPPYAGNFSIGMLNETRFDSLARANLDGDLNRDGNPDGSSRLFAVLWDERTNDVWVDTDQDLSFTDEKALTDFSERPEFGVLGTDDPDTPVRESIAFAVQTNREKQRVALNMGIDRHGSLVVGAALASKGTDGRFDGMAPGARLGNFSEGYASYGQTEATIAAAKHPDVDVIFFEQGSGITRPYLLRDGRLVPTVIFTRLIEKYRKPIVVPTHNYPILGGIDDFVLARGAIGIGGHESKDNFFTNHGVRVEHQHNLLITGGYGPMGNGALKPDVISASNYVSTARGFQEGGSMEGLFQLPPGYTIAGGTSTATPTAAGAVALLISAAKQTGVQYDAFRIKHAVAMSARYVPHLPAYKQGNGVINIGAAWEILQALDTARVDVTITSRAPVHHAYSHMLPTPHEGVGLYERDWSVGETGERTVTFTRTSGPRDPMTFALSWTGDDGETFSAPESVTLPFNRAVPVEIGIAPEHPGAHTALLTLDHPGVPGHAYRMLATVVAGEAITATDSFTVVTEAEIPRPGMASYFYRVPEGVSALQIAMRARERPVRLAVIRPDTRSEGGVGSQPDGTVVIYDPMPGTWEVRLSDTDDTRNFDRDQAKKPEPVPPTKATITVTAMATDVSVQPGDDDDTQPDVRAGTATYELSLSNRMASFTGSAANTPMGSARRERPAIAEREQQVFEVEVPEGTPFLLARVFGTSDPGADLDLYAYSCTERGCRRAGGDADPVGDELVLVTNPRAGTWKIVVDAAAVPSGSTEYEYLDVVFNPLYGTVAVADAPEERELDGEWTATALSWVTAAAEESGRTPYPAVLVRGGDGDGFPVALRALVGESTAATGAEQN